MHSSDDDFEFRIMNPPTSFSIQDDVEEQILSPLSCLREFESYWLLEFDLPLVEKDDISVLIDENTLTVQANLKEVYSQDTHGYHAEFKSFEKSITLPPKIDADKITAQFSNERLFINIPKIRSGHKIKIE